MAPEERRLLRALLRNERVLSLGVIVDGEPLVVNLDREAFPEAGTLVD